MEVLPISLPCSFCPPPILLPSIYSVFGTLCVALEG